MKMARGIVYGAAALLCGALLAALPQAAQAAEESPSCVLMKFTNDTRFKKLEPEIMLSELVLEKMAASGRFRLKETRPIDSAIETQLYDEDRRLAAPTDAAVAGDFDALFESGEAAGISSAHEGQVISPELTAKVGREHGAEYLIQGTILNLGRGQESDNNVGLATGFASVLGGLFGRGGRAVADVARNTDKTYSGTTVQSDLRVIKASTGEVVWQTMVTSTSKQSKVKVGEVAVGNDAVNMNLYEKALDQAAEKIVAAMLADMDKGILFGK